MTSVREMNYVSIIISIILFIAALKDDIPIDVRNQKMEPVYPIPCDGIELSEWKQSMVTDVPQQVFMQS
jgi:hypothetical protein